MLNYIKCFTFIFFVSAITFAFDAKFNKVFFGL